MMATVVSMTDETQADTTDGRVEALPAWKVILKMVRYRLGLWLVNLAAMLILIFFWQLPAVIMREFFDLLTGEAQLGLNVWSVVALLFACELGRVLGIYGLVKTLGEELAPHRIRVNAIAPGSVRTPRIIAMQESGEAPTQQLDLDKMAECDDVGAAMLFLCSDLARKVTGQTLVVDGGVTTSFPFRTS